MTPVKKFCVGLNGRPGFTELVLGKFSKHVHEVFVAAPASVCQTGRWGHAPVSEEEIERGVALAHRHGVRYNVLLNGLCLGGKQFSDPFLKNILRFVRFIESVGTDGVTAVDPAIIDLVRKNSGLHITVGSWAEVVEPVRARRLAAHGVNRIVLHQNVYRDFEMLKKIRDAVDIELEIIPNQGCLYQCEWGVSHHNMTSHASVLSEEERKELGGFNLPIKRCTAIRQSNPTEFLMSSLIRPEDLRIYEGLGFRLFKIAGRNRPTEWIINCLNAYVNGSYDGNVFDLSCHIGENRKSTFLPSKCLDGWYSHMGSVRDYDDFRRKAEEFYKERNLGQYFTSQAITPG